MMTAIETLYDMIGRLWPGDMTWADEDGVVVGLEMLLPEQAACAFHVVLRVGDRIIDAGNGSDLEGALRDALGDAQADGDADLAWALAVVLGLSAHERAALARRAG